MNKRDQEKITKNTKRERKYFKNYISFMLLSVICYDKNLATIFLHIDRLHGRHLYNVNNNNNNISQSVSTFQLVRTCTTCQGVVNVAVLILSLCLEHIEIL